MIYHCVLSDKYLLEWGEIATRRKDVYLKAVLSRFKRIDLLEVSVLETTEIELCKIICRIKKQKPESPLIRYLINQGMSQADNFLIELNRIELDIPKINLLDV